MSRKILVVEDEPMLGEMVCDNLQSQGYESTLVTDGEAAVQHLIDDKFDLVILDIMLPKLDGFGVLKRMRGAGDQTPVLVLSARSADADRIQGLELQADDYLCKPFNLRELLLRVAALLRRVAQTPSEVDELQFAGFTVDFRGYTVVKPDGQSVKLTDTETKLLRLLSTRESEVVDRRELVDHLFGPASLPSNRTLDNLILNLRKLFEADTRSPKHIHTVRGVGFRFTKEPPA